MLKNGKINKTLSLEFRVGNTTRQTRQKPYPKLQKLKIY